MTVELQMRQRKERESRKPLPVRTECPKCHSKALLNEGPDQFCTDCDWDTCAAYVELGLMNNLAAAYKDHFPASRGEIQKSKNNLTSGDLEKFA